MKTILLIIIMIAIVVFATLMMRRATWGPRTRKKAVAAEIHYTDSLKEQYPDAPNPFLTESFTLWACRQIDRDFPYETGADGLGPDGETGKKHMLTQVEEGNIENLWCYDHALAEARIMDEANLLRAERRRAMEQYRHERAESATDGNSGRTVYYFKTDNCHVMGKNMDAWLFSDHYVGLESDGLDHKKQLESDGKDVVKLYPDMKEHEDLIREICDYHGFDFNSII